MGLGQWGKKSVVRCLAWLQIKPVDSLKLITNHNSYKIVLVAKRIYFRVKKVKGVTKKYMLVGDVEVPYEHPPQVSLKWTFFYRFLCSFWWNMLPEANHRQYCQIAIFNMAAWRHVKMPKIEKWEFP